MNRCSIVCLVVLSLLVPSGVLAADMEFHSRLRVSEEYNDNINLSSNNEQEDWVTTISPGISLTYDARSLDASVDYSLEYIFYKNNSDSNQDTFKDIQRADAQLLFFPGRPFTLTISENISRQTIDERDVFSEDNQLVNKTTVYDTRVSPQFRWRLSPTFSLVLGYDYERTDYTSGQADDGEDHTARTSLVKSLSSTLDTSLNYSYRWHIADLDEDEYDTQRLTLGLNYQPTSRTSLSLEGGISRVEYNNASDNGQDDVGFGQVETNITSDDEQILTWNLDLSHRLTNVLSTSLSYAQDFTTSATRGLTLSRRAAWGLTWDRELLTVAGQLYWDQNDYKRENRQDDTFGTSLSLNQQFSRYFSGSIDGSYEWAEFKDSGDTEEVGRYRLGTSLSYSYSRFVTSLAYRHRIHDSNYDSNDYTNNTVTLTASVSF